MTVAEVLTDFSLLHCLAEKSPPLDPDRHFVTITRYCISTLHTTFRCSSSFCDFQIFRLKFVFIPHFPLHLILLELTILITFGYVLNYVVRYQTVLLQSVSSCSGLFGKPILVHCVINCFLRSGSSLPNTMLEAHLLSAVDDFLSVYSQLLMQCVKGLFPGGKAGWSVVLTTHLLQRRFQYG